ncbi:hypothetical protein ABVK25_002020 [Lepraria finkii]|uniref:Uncharacterized protein n=1 Tax=Lepraria finkii TaxID=1340010 RepID=A0ABR4BKU4_9LECA
MSRDGLLLHLRKYSNLDNTRPFLTSRLNVDIPRTFSPMLRVEIAASTPDITACLESEMHKSNRFGALYSEDLKQEIIKRSVEKTYGYFLLASLQIDSLCKQISSSRVRAALEVLPTAVFATYDDAFKRIVDQSKDHAELGMRVTSLVFCAMRSLKIEELGHALAVQTGDCTLDRGDLTIPEIILGATAGLVSTFQSEYRWGEAHLSSRLVHYTLQEYLDADRS